MREPHPDAPLTLHIGHDELNVRRRYETLSIVNDILIALWFVAGSVLFFFPSTTTPGTWLFLVGSLQLLIRPVIRLMRNVHITRVSTNPPGLASAARDF